jgi:two-component system chemotaxis sensor kinase CheA
LPELADIVEGLAAGVTAADPGDRPGMARLRAAFDRAAGVAEASAGAGLSGGVGEAVAARARRAGDLVGLALGGNAADAQQAMDAVVRLVTEIQGTLAATGSPAESAARAGAAWSIPTWSDRTTGSDPLAIAGTSAQADPYAGPEPDFADPGAAELGREFIAEATAHVEAAEAALLALEESGDDPETVKALFRAFHTIKGTAGFVDLKQIPRLAHETETLLDLARQGHLDVAGPVADVVLDAIDRMRAMVGGLRSAVDAGTVPPADPSLPALLDRVRAAADVGVASGPPVSERTREDPDGSGPRAGILPPGPHRLAVPTHPGLHGYAQTPGCHDPLTGRTHPSATIPAPALAESSVPAPAGEQSVKVSTDRLDRLVNAVGELAIAQAMVEQSVMAGGVAAASAGGTETGLGRDLAHLGKLCRELQDLAMSMRMVPIQGVFQKMARLARDLTRKSDKQIEFVATGGETELDRTLVEAVADPLVHMIRNAADHGIELPAARVAAGKPPAGRIDLRAYHQGGGVVVEVRDDGRGLAKAKILAKAVARGLVPAGQPMTDQETFALIFHPGLSTADQVTDVSGRGVGMDVVKRNVERLRGRIEIASTEGAGTTFTVRLPLTLAVIDGLVAGVGADRFIIPLLGVEQSVRLAADQLSTLHGRGEMCLFRGSLLPVVRLGRLFGIPGAVEEATDGIAVVVRDDRRRCCLLVDALLGRQQVVIKALGDAVGPARGVAGGAILGDGRVSLIVDVPSLLDMAAGR